MAAIGAAAEVTKQAKRSVEEAKLGRTAERPCMG
jgi:hypothetical protein